LGMSFIIFLVNVLIFMGVAHRKHRALFISAAGIIFLGVLTFGSLKKTEAFPVTRTLHVSVIQADISPQEKASLDHFNQNIARHMRLTERSFGQEQPDLVIWPETAFPDDLLQNDQWRPLIFALAQRMKADILLGIAPIIEGKEYNSAILINDHLGVGGLYHKQALVPFAETMPLEAWGIHWGRGYHFSAGHKPGLFAIKGGFLRFGVVICSESAHPAMVRQLRRSGARFLVELSNDGWFTDKASYMLHAQAAVMRAVEEHMWVIRAANTGWSFAVAPDGTIHTDGNLKLGREGFGNFDIMVNSP